VRLHGVWYIQGQYGESSTWFSRILALNGGPAFVRTMVANWASMHALSRGDFVEARHFSEEARQLAMLSNDPTMAVLSLDGEGAILLEQGKLLEAAAVFKREYQLLQDVHMDWLLACVLYRLGMIRLEFGDPDEAEHLCTQALRALGTENNVWIRLRVERVFGTIALQRGDLPTAEVRCGTVLRGVRQLGDLQGLAYALIDVCQVEHAQRHLPTARALVREALEVAARDGEPLVQTRVLECAALVLASARPEGALQILAAALRMRDRLDAAAWPLERLRIDRTLELAHARLSTTAAAVASASGEVIGVERAVRLARELLDSLDPSIASNMLPPHDVLTPRELEVADLVSRGMTNRAIAQTLVISEGTVRAHVEHILGKLGLRSRTEIGKRLGRASAT
jgi:DNA-binding NarL/FixJ family response regulator